jgi:hypothetical protein
MKQGIPGISHKSVLPYCTNFEFYRACVTKVYIPVSNNELHFISCVGILCCGQITIGSHLTLVRIFPLVNMLRVDYYYYYYYYWPLAVELST